MVGVGVERERERETGRKSEQIEPRTENSHWVEKVGEVLIAADLDGCCCSELDGIRRKAGL